VQAVTQPDLNTVKDWSSDLVTSWEILFERLSSDIVVHSVAFGKESVKSQYRLRHFCLLSSCSENSQFETSFGSLFFLPSEDVLNV